MGLLSFLTNENVLGLDIGYESLKLVELKKNGKENVLVGSFEMPLTERIMEKDQIKNKAGVATMIKEACRKAKPCGIGARRIVTALPETFVFSKTVQLPKMKDDEYSKAILAESSQYLPIPAEEAYLDYQVLINRPDEPMADILIVAAPKKLVDDYVEMCSLADMELAALETKPIAIGRAVSAHESLNGLVIVEIGTEFSRVSIWDDNQIRLSTTVNIGKNQIFETMGWTEFSGNGPAVSQDNFAQLIPTMGAITEGAVSAIKYHKNRDYKPSPVKKIFLCGTGAKIKNIDKFFEEETKVSCQIIAPKLAGAPLGTEYMTTFGLALRSE